MAKNIRKVELKAAEAAEKNKIKSADILRFICKSVDQYYERTENQ